MGPAERREHLARLMSKNEKLTAQELAQIFDVSERTIYRDIEAMTPFYPIYARAGHDGGVRMMRTYSFNRIYMTEKEIGVLKKAMEIIDGNPNLFTIKDRDLLDTIIREHTRPVCANRKGK